MRKISDKCKAFKTGVDVPAGSPDDSEKTQKKTPAMSQFLEASVRTTNVEVHDI